MKYTYFFAAILACISVLASCNKEQLESPKENTDSNLYTLTISASKELVTKQLSLDGTGNTLNAVWAEGEVVKVLYGEPKVEVGTLSPLSYGSADAVLSGTVDVSGMEAGHYIDLVFGGDLSGQDGSLENLSKYHDWAKAWFTIKSKILTIY